MKEKQAIDSTEVIYFRLPPPLYFLTNFAQTGVVYAVHGTSSSAMERLEFFILFLNNNVLILLPTHNFVALPGQGSV